jgi:hypothetical protein
MEVNWLSGSTFTKILALGANIKLPTDWVWLLTEQTQIESKHSTEFDEATNHIV